jgi:hypothetical protein
VVVVVVVAAAVAAVVMVAVVVVVVAVVAVVVVVVVVAATVVVAAAVVVVAAAVPAAGGEAVRSEHAGHPESGGLGRCYSVNTLLTNQLDLSPAEHTSTPCADATACNNANGKTCPCAQRELQWRGPRSDPNQLLVHGVEGTQTTHARTHTHRRANSESHLAIPPAVSSCV